MSTVIVRPPPPGGPWYRNHGYWTGWANRYLDAYHSLPNDAPQQAEVRSFGELAAIRAVFESNQLEGAGLSLGETRRAVAEYFAPLPPRDPPRPWSLERLLESAGRLDALVDEANGHQVRPVLQFQGRARPIREVIQHFQAMADAREVGAGIAAALDQWRWARTLVLDPGQCELLRRGFGDLLQLPVVDDWPIFRAIRGDFQSPADVPCPPLLTVDHARTLHRQLAHDLLGTDARVAPGELRLDSRSVGLSLAFPAPELLPACMEAWQRRANAVLYDDPERGSAAIQAAAAISYDFVRIHPFPDFNGRMSRLLMNLALAAYGLPFPLSLRGGATGKHRYLSSLQKVDRLEDLQPYEALIAMSVVEHFEEVDANLRIAGLPTILGLAPSRPSGIRSQT